MERMAGNHKYYLITSVHSYDDAVNIDNFTFDVRDVIWDDEPGPEDVVLPGEKQHFNPEDLQL
ncbi:MAG: hypothetical protein R3267_04330 [Paenisporosarcina sp.]|nr:hypothetical protein [Paenisporosarcina sp.]